MINKNKFRILNDKKKLHKIGKQWVTVSAMTLALLAGGAVVHSYTPTNAQQINTTEVNQNNRSTSGNVNNIQKSANKLYGTIYNANVKKNISLSALTENNQNNSSNSNKTNNNSGNSTKNSSNNDVTQNQNSKSAQPNSQNSNNGIQQSSNSQPQQLSDLNPNYHYKSPYQPQGQDQVDQMNFVYLLNGQPMNANEVPDITHTRTKDSDYDLSKYDENNPYKLYDGTKLYGYNILAHGGTPFSNDFNRYMPKYFNGYKLKKPVFPVDKPQVDMWNSRKIGTEFKGSGTNGITYYLDYTQAQNTIWYHIDNRPSVTALSDVSNGNNGNTNSDYDHNMSDFVKNAKNGKWANLPYSDVRVGYHNGQPQYKEMQDVVVKTDINHRGYSDFFKKVGNNYKYGQSDLESYVPRQFTIDAEPMASITIHFLYNGKDVTTPIVKTGVEHQPFDISQYSNDLPQGYHYINNTIENSTLSDANPKYFDEPCDTTAFGTVMQGAGKNAGQYSNNKDVNVILTKDNTDTINYSYNGKVLPNPYKWSGTSDVHDLDYTAEVANNALSRIAENQIYTKDPDSDPYTVLTNQFHYPRHQGYTINQAEPPKLYNSIMQNEYSPKTYGKIHVTIPLQKVQDTIKYINMNNGKKLGSTWINKYTSDMASDNDTQLHQFRSDILNIAYNYNVSDSYNDLQSHFNLLPGYSIVNNNIYKNSMSILNSNMKVIDGVPSFQYGKFNLVIPVQTDNPATHTLEYVNASNNNVVSRYQQTGSDNDIDSDINTNFVNSHVPEYYQIDTSKQQPNVSNIHYDNGVTKIPVKQLTTGITIKYVDLDNIYNPYGQNKYKKYADYYGELGSDTVTNNLQEPFIPFNVTNYNGTNYESSKAINDIAKVNNYQYFYMISGNNVHQFSDKPQTIVIGLQKVSDNSITYTYNGKPVGSWTSKTQDSTNKDNQEIINLHDKITPFKAPNLPKGYIIPVKSDQNGVSDYSKFTSDDNPLEPNNINYYHYGQHYTIPVAKDTNTITVDYVDKDTGKIISKAGSDTEKVNTPFDISNYMSNLPSDYNYAGIKNNRTIFGSKDYTIDILLSKNPQGSIKVNYVDKNTNQTLKSTNTVTNNVGTPFNITPYTSNSDIPKGYVYSGINNNTQYFNKGKQTVTILLSKLSTVGIHYVDAQTGSDVKDTLPITKPSGTNINLQQYQKNIPSGYKYFETQIPTLNSKFNGTTFDNNNHIITILLQREKGTIQVNYIDKQNNKTIKTLQPITAFTNTPFNVDKYTKTNNLPNGYGYAGINNNVTKFNDCNQTINVYLNKLGKININYIDANSGKTLLTRLDIKPINTPVDISSYLNDLPNKYNYVGMSTENSTNNNNFDGTKFEDGTNTIIVLLNKEPTPKVARSTITINYVDAKNTSHIIGQAGKKTANVSTPFDIGLYLNGLPKGYEYSGIKNANSNDDFNGTEYDYNNHTIDILLIKIRQPRIARSKITVNDVDAKTDQLIRKVGSDTEDISTPFDIGHYLSVPKGYEYIGTKNANSSDNFNGTEFDYNNHTINVLLSKLPQGTINVNYVDKDNHQVVAQAKPVTKQVGKPFNINNYLDGLPTGYEYSGMNGDINYFEKGNHTVDIVVKKIPAPKPVTPNSSSASSTSSNSRKASSQSSANSSTSAKPSSKASSASVKPNSSSSSSTGQSVTSNSKSNSSGAKPQSLPSNQSSSKASSTGNSTSAKPSSSSSIPSSIASNTSSNESKSQVQPSNKSDSNQSVVPNSTSSSTSSSSTLPFIPSSTNNSSSDTESSMPSSTGSGSSASSVQGKNSSTSSNKPTKPKYVKKPQKNSQNHGLNNKHGKHNSPKNPNRPQNHIKHINGNRAEPQTRHYDYSSNHSRRFTAHNINRNNNVRPKYATHKKANKLPQTSESSFDVAVFGLVMIVLGIIFMALDEINKRFNK